MNRSPIDRITAAVAALGAVMTAVAYALGGATTGAGVLLGAAIAFGNWMLLRWLLARWLGRGRRPGSGFALLAMFKMGGLLGLVAAVLLLGLAEPLPFALGYSALVAGIGLGAVAHLARPSVQQGR